MHMNIYETDRRSDIIARGVEEGPGPTIPHSIWLGRDILELPPDYRSENPPTTIEATKTKTGVFTLILYILLFSL